MVSLRRALWLAVGAALCLCWIAPLRLAQYVHTPVKVGTARVEQALPGERLEAGTEETPLRIACGEGALAILKLQPAGKKPLSALDYLRGKPLPAGALLERG